MTSLRAVPIAVLLFAGCAGPEPPRWHGYLNKPVMTVAVLKPFETGGNPSDEALDALYDKVVKELVHRGYEVLPKEKVFAFYQGKAIGIPAELYARYKGRMDVVAKELGAQSLLCTNVSEWGREVAGVVNNIQVKIEFILMDANGKDEVWKNYAEKKLDLNAVPTTDTKSLGKSIFGAVAGTVLNSPDDLMPEVVLNAFGSLGHAGFGH